MREQKTLLTVLVDGETKTGKGAASKSIAEALEAAGFKVYYGVAGDFYRRYTVLVRRALQLGEDDFLVPGADLERATQAVHATGQAFDAARDLGDLQRPIISKSVAILAELPLAQQAGAEWWRNSLENALSRNADVFVVDGRNPRLRIADVLAHTPLPVRTALDLYLTCEPAEAARRNLLQTGNDQPAADGIAEEQEHIATRRDRDRQRVENPFISPPEFETYNFSSLTAAEVLRAAWDITDPSKAPRTIVIDNTSITIHQLTSTVNELALAAVQHLDKN